MSDIIKVNHVEAASEIAIQLMKQKYRENGWKDEVIDDIFYEEKTTGTLTLKGEYQDQFNHLYDLIYTILEKIKYE